MLTVQLSILRPSGEICVDVDALDTHLGIAAETKSGFTKGEAIPLTDSEQLEAEDCLRDKSDMGVLLEMQGPPRSSPVY